MSFRNTTNKLYDTYYDWENSSKNIHTQKTLITGVPRFDPDELSEQMHNKIKELEIKTLVDYGAGLGRNLPLLKSIGDSVDYVDLETYKENYENVVSELGYDEVYFIKMLPTCLVKKYDACYASVVLQHIVDNDIHENIVKILSKQCKYMIFVQNVCIRDKKKINDYFELLYTETHKKYFIDNHDYSIYKSLFYESP
jgi:hypothetical protein